MPYSTSNTDREVAKSVSRLEGKLLTPSDDLRNEMIVPRTPNPGLSDEVEVEELSEEELRRLARERLAEIRVSHITSPKQVEYLLNHSVPAQENPCQGRAIACQARIRRS